MDAGRLTIAGRRVQVKAEYLKNCVDAVDDLVGRIV
jgi:hypothetical protein